MEFLSGIVLDFIWVLQFSPPPQYCSRNKNILFDQVLRNNENSILAVLETFVYDPLINWRLVEDYEVDGHGRQIQVCALVSVVPRFTVQFGRR